MAQSRERKWLEMGLLILVKERQGSRDTTTVKEDFKEHDTFEGLLGPIPDPEAYMRVQTTTLPKRGTQRGKMHTMGAKGEVEVCFASYMWRHARGIQAVEWDCREMEGVS